jgi:hypothetical protein
MLGRRSAQSGLFDAGNLLGAEQVRKIPFYGHLAATWREIFRDEDFAEFYADVGRWSVPPSILATATVLQHFENISDAEVVERTKYDLRWKAVFDTDPCSLQPLFAKSSLQLFRLRLVLNEKQGLIFDAVLAEARRRGLLPKQLQVALDSSPVRGRGAVKDAFNLLSDAIGRVVRAVAKEEEAEPLELAQSQGLERHLQRGSVKGSRVVDWEDEVSVRAFLAELVEDCKKAVEVAKNAQTVTAEVELLAKVVEENVEETPDGPQIPPKVPKGRTTSVHDEEMHHGHKSTGKLYTGHKAHVGVDTSSQFLTAIEMSEPSSPEGEHVGSLIEQSETRTESSVNESLGDCAYSTRTAQAQAAEAQVPLVTKMPAPPKGRFGPGDFEVSEDGEEATCPAGLASAKVGHRKVGIVHRWSPEQCGSCPHRERCVHGEATHRTLTIPSDFKERREREAYARSPEGREKLRLRTLVEHAIGYLKNLGAGRARYVGRAKTLFQWLACGAVVNLRRLFQPVPVSATSLLLATLLPLLLLVFSAAPANAGWKSLGTHPAIDVQEEAKADHRSPRRARSALSAVEDGASLSAATSLPRSRPLPATTPLPSQSRRWLLRRRNSPRDPPGLPRQCPWPRPSDDCPPRQARSDSMPDPRHGQCCASAYARQAHSLAAGSLTPIGHPARTANTVRSARPLSQSGKIRGRIAASCPVRRVGQSCAGGGALGAGEARAPPVSRPRDSQNRGSCPQNGAARRERHSRPGS